MAVYFICKPENSNSEIQRESSTLINYNPLIITKTAFKRLVEYFNSKSIDLHNKLLNIDNTTEFLQPDTEVENTEEENTEEENTEEENTEEENTKEIINIEIEDSLRNRYEVSKWTKCKLTVYTKRKHYSFEKNIALSVIGHKTNNGENNANWRIRIEDLNLNEMLDDEDTLRGEEERDIYVIMGIIEKYQYKDIIRNIECEGLEIDIYMQDTVQYDEYYEQIATKYLKEKGKYNYETGTIITN